MLLPTLKGEKINLRRIRKSDAESLQRNANDPEVTRYLFTPYPYTLEYAYNFIKVTHKMHRQKSGYPMGVENKQTKEIVGLIGLHRLDLVNKNAEIGFWLGKKYWGMGFTKEAVRLMLEFAFGQLQLHRVYARSMHPNVASQRLLESIGFTREGVMREAVWKNEEWLDFILYSKLNK